MQIQTRPHTRVKQDGKTEHNCGNLAAAVVATVVAARQRYTEHKYFRIRFIWEINATAKCGFLRWFTQTGVVFARTHAVLAAAVNTTEFRRA